MSYFSFKTSDLIITIVVPIAVVSITIWELGWWIFENISISIGVK